MKKKIGIFDSGVGGLNVLSDLIEHYPNEDFLYLADTANCPYGLKSAEEVKLITENNIRFLEQQNVKAIIIACNTATSHSYNIKANVPIIRIIEPTANNALKVGKRIAVLATNLTITSNAYQKFIPNAIGIKGSVLVELAENGKAGFPETQFIIDDLLAPVKGRIDTIILGCTHFTLFTEHIKKALGNVNIVDSSLSIKDVIKDIVEESEGPGVVELLTTGDPMSLNLNFFNKEYKSINHIDI